MITMNADIVYMVLGANPSIMQWGLSIILAVVTIITIAVLFYALDD